MGFWTDIDEDYVLEFQKWHNCEHMTERTSIPGFHVGRRYRGLDEAPMFFISYETAETAVFKSELYLAALNNPTSWTQEALTHFKNSSRNLYNLLTSIGAQAPTEAPYALVYRFNMPSETEAETLSWYSTEWMPVVQALEGVYRIRLYEVDEEISNIMTSERAIYGGGPGQQKYMAYYELGSPDIPSGDDWRGLRQAGRNTAMFGDLRNVFEELSWLEFVMYAPETD